MAIYAFAAASRDAGDPTSPGRGGFLQSAARRCPGANRRFAIRAAGLDRDVWRRSACPNVLPHSRWTTAAVPSCELPSSPPETTVESNLSRCGVQPRRSCQLARRCGGASAPAPSRALEISGLPGQPYFSQRRGRLSGCHEWPDCPNFEFGAPSNRRVLINRARFRAIVIPELILVRDTPRIRVNGDGPEVIGSRADSDSPRESS